ncbi:uncharacterized protein SPSK_06800 [Sporothrix schenckii 1099-18]|uniref:Uncharacterized protein n=1 Tax=Sporothrix schenckii 1099-18 TaxID=1397361 RepID=A0A0F2MIA0_SPOSC|nr:uncharacterized protein SPSK_06800 [Sporothrix schenckii 1099-18]KJR89357.1 hypothetical protein SPSK_06800 [Sporothrix schenckii 1099-18]
MLYDGVMCFRIAWTGISSLGVDTMLWSSPLFKVSVDRLWSRPGWEATGDYGQDDYGGDVCNLETSRDTEHVALERDPDYNSSEA